MSSASWQVHKFGGTSLADAERIARATGLVASTKGRCAVVLSAMAGVTDELIALLDGARRRDIEGRDRFAALCARHRSCAQELLGDSEELTQYLGVLEREARDLEDILRATWLLQSYAEPTLEYVSGHGELWSARLFAALLGRQTPAWFVDARDVLVVAAGPTGPTLNEAETQPRLDAAVRAAEESVLVMTGYVARNLDGTPTTLKRNGSDLSASLLGSLLDAGSITIWTDVDGVLTADPRKVPEAVVTAELSYAEAAELAYFGAKVIHPHTMAPAIEKGIPIHIKNSFAPERPGSTIGPTSPGAEKAPVVRGFASVDDIALVNVEGTGMMGVPGVAERMFRALSDARVNVVLIAQASSEHSICVAVDGGQGSVARDAVARAFTVELDQGQIDNVDLVAGCSVLAAVGDRMAEVPGVAGRMLSALGHAGVNVRAVAQGSSERNISVVVDSRDVVKGLRAAHASFLLSDQTLSLALIGPGLIGTELLRQLDQQRALLTERFKIDLRVRAIASSRHMVLTDDPLPVDAWREPLERGPATDLDALSKHLHAPHLPHKVIIDCTASEAVAAKTPEWLASGIHVVTPNKKACAGPLERFETIQRLRQERRVHFFSEATVGAGLPILSTLRDLLKTGDRILSVEGVLSGTLSFLFNTYDGETPFSSLVRSAREQGFTEPDPRDDLSGTDVARKVIILAREMGLSVSLDDVETESLVPASLADAANPDAFLDGLAQFDDDMRKKLEDARRAGGVLRYVGAVAPGEGGSVALRVYAKDHAFARLSGSDNIIAFTTERYQEQPLIVQGPGAGPAVTAAGVFSDLLRLAAHLGARS